MNQVFATAPSNLFPNAHQITQSVANPPNSITKDGFVNLWRYQFPFSFPFPYAIDSQVEKDANTVGLHSDDEIHEIFGLQSAPFRSHHRLRVLSHHLLFSFNF